MPRALSELHGGSVYYSRRSRPSAMLLINALRVHDYDGPSINWGWPGQGLLNTRAAVLLASNKRLALAAMSEAHVQTPMVCDPSEANSGLDEQGGLVEWGDCLQFVGRSDHHRAGSNMWFCTNKFQVNDATRAGATHFLEYLYPAREFRVHVAFGKSIKLTEKTLVGEHVRPVVHPVLRSFSRGWRSRFPEDFGHRVSVRDAGKRAVTALGLDFGAVDVLWHNDEPFVLEVNTAPALTSASDVLARYVRAFCER